MNYRQVHKICFFELFSCHGLPTDSKKANYIISHADFVVAEGWDLRFGVTLWEQIEQYIKNTKWESYKKELKHNCLYVSSMFKRTDYRFEASI